MPAVDPSRRGHDRRGRRGNAPKAEAKSVTRNETKRPRRMPVGALPIPVEHPYAGEAVAMITEWSEYRAERDRRENDVVGERASYVDFMRQLTLREAAERDAQRERPEFWEHKAAKTYVDAAGRRIMDIAKAYTARGSASDSGPKPTEGSEAPLSTPKTASVREAEAIMAYLERNMPPSYFALWQWTLRTPFSDIADEIGCGRERVYGHLQSGILVAATLVEIRWFA
jgi:hypothetical protein